jgi:hypothetical protein
MPRLITEITDDLDGRFRKEVGKRFGAKKGNLQEAVIEALELWLKQKG